MAAAAVAVVLVVVVVVVVVAIVDGMVTFFIYSIHQKFVALYTAFLIIIVVNRFRPSCPPIMILKMHTGFLSSNVRLATLLIVNHSWMKYVQNHFWGLHLQPGIILDLVHIAAKSQCRWLCCIFRFSHQRRRSISYASWDYRHGDGVFFYTRPVCLVIYYTRRIDSNAICSLELINIGLWYHASTQANKLISWIHV